jgi:hypothetical protein
MKHLFRDTITLYPNATKDEYGRDNASSGVAYRGRAVIETSVVPSSIIGQMSKDKAEEYTADAKFFLPIEANVSIGDKAMYNGVKYRVIALKRVKDDISEKFIKTYVKRTI